MEDDTLGSGYPGVNRLYYFLGRVVLILIVVFSVMFFGPESVAFTVVSIAAMVAGIWLDVMRLRNIGVSRWFVFLRYLPFVSLLFWIGTQSAQPGWAETRRLDRAGWAILAVHVAIFVLTLFVAFRTGIEIFGIPFR
jgi:uncharacterized membrane protein YhaH (DUF805 family)